MPKQYYWKGKPVDAKELSERKAEAYAELALHHNLNRKEAKPFVLARQQSGWTKAVEDKNLSVFHQNKRGKQETWKKKHAQSFRREKIKRRKFKRHPK